MGVRAADYDAIVVGAGHNGLVCAGYLARAGLKVLVVERRAIVGGAVCTEELFPGYLLDTGSVVHVLIQRTPILRDLRLDEVGLDYLELDPWGFAPFPDGKTVFFYRDLDRTCESIARVAPRDAEAYRGYVEHWTRINELLLPAFLAPPELPTLLAAVAGRGLPTLVKLFGRPGAAAVARWLLSSYGQVLRETFESEYVRGPLTQLAATSGPPPEEPGSADLLGWHALWHSVGVWRPRGGSGALAGALARRIAAWGGEVRTGAAVRRILVEGKRAAGVELAGGERITSRIVVSAGHVQRALLDLVDPADLPVGLRRRVEQIQVRNGIGMTVQCALRALPSYAGLPAGPSPAHAAIQILCPAIATMTRAYADYLLGRPATRPSMYALTATALDPTLAPPGGHTLYLWGQYHPYQLAGGERWEDAGEREADKLIGILAEYAPNVAGSIRARFVQTPLDLERRLGLYRAHCLHVDQSLDQMFFFRPLPELAGYRAPIAGLYLTGAGTHPIGGVTGMPGHNTAHVILADQGRGRRLFTLGAGLAALGILDSTLDPSFSIQAGGAS